MMKDAKKLAVVDVGVLIVANGLAFAGERERLVAGGLDIGAIVGRAARAVAARGEVVYRVT